MKSRGMDFTQITEHIYQLETDLNLFGVFSFSVSIWLVRTEDGWVLIDGGFPYGLKLVCAAIEQATEGKGPKLLLLTHGHLDHTGCMGVVRRAWNPVCLCHSAEAPFVRGERSYARLPVTSGPFRYARWAMFVAGSKNAITDVVEDGQTVAGLEVVHLPGHTPGQVGFLHLKDRALICGDAVMNRNARLSLPFALATPDPAQARESVRKMCDLEFDHLFASHGDLIFDSAREALTNFVQDEFPQNETHPS